MTIDPKLRAIYYVYLLIGDPKNGVPAVEEIIKAELSAACQNTLGAHRKRQHSYERDILEKLLNGLEH